MRGWYEVMAVSTLCGMAGLASAQSATVRIEGPDIATIGEVITLTVFVDFEGLPAEALGLAGWNIGIDIAEGTITGAKYLSDAHPLVDQNNPFAGDPAPEILGGRTVELNEGLNAFNETFGFHTGGALAEIYVDTTGQSDLNSAVSRLGGSPLGAFTYAMPVPPDAPPFSYIGFDFQDGTYGRWRELPTPTSLSVLAADGLLVLRRRR